MTTKFDRKIRKLQHLHKLIVHHALTKLRFGMRDTDLVLPSQSLTERDHRILADPRVDRVTESVIDRVQRSSRQAISEIVRYVSTTVGMFVFTAIVEFITRRFASGYSFHMGLAAAAAAYFTSIRHLIIPPSPMNRKARITGPNGQSLEVTLEITGLSPWENALAATENFVITMFVYMIKQKLYNQYAALTEIPDVMFTSLFQTGGQIYSQVTSYITFPSNPDTDPATAVAVIKMYHVINYLLVQVGGNLFGSKPLDYVTDLIKKLIRSAEKPEKVQELMGDFMSAVVSPQMIIRRTAIVDLIRRKDAGGFISGLVAQDPYRIVRILWNSLRSSEFSIELGRKLQKEHTSYEIAEYVVNHVFTEYTYGQDIYSQIKKHEIVRYLTKPIDGTIKTIGDDIQYALVLPIKRIVRSEIQNMLSKLGSTVQDKGYTEILTRDVYVSASISAILLLLCARLLPIIIECVAGNEFLTRAQNMLRGVTSEQQRITTTPSGESHEQQPYRIAGGSPVEQYYVTTGVVPQPTTPAVEQSPAVEPEQRPAVEPEQRPAVEPEQRPAVEPEQRPAQTTRRSPRLRKTPARFGKRYNRRFALS